MAAIHDWELAEWQRIVTLNLTGVFHGFKAVAPLILESGGGAIVSTASISGTRPAAGEAPYAAAKAAVAALTASAALEYAPSIRVNAVSPGMIATPLTHAAAREARPRPRGAHDRPRRRWPGSARPRTSPTSWCSCAPTSPGS